MRHIRKKSTFLKHYPRFPIRINKKTTIQEKRLFSHFLLKGKEKSDKTFILFYTKIL